MDRIAMANYKLQFTVDGAQHVALAGWGPPLPKRDQLGVGGGTATVAPSPDTKQLPHTRSMHSHPPSPRPKWGQQISGGGDPIENIRPPPPIPILRAHCQPRATEGILCPHPTAVGCSGGGNAGGTVAGLGGSGAKGGGGGHLWDSPQYKNNVTE